MYTGWHGFYFLTSHQGGANGMLNDFYKLWGRFNVNRQRLEQQEEHCDLLLNVQTQHVDSFHQHISTLSTTPQGSHLREARIKDNDNSTELFNFKWIFPICMIETNTIGSLTVTMGGPSISPSHWFELQKKKAKCYSTSYHYWVSLSFRFPNAGKW